MVSATVVLTAVWLGILTSISPCPLATNVAAMSFIGKEVRSPRRILLTGLLYTAGRSLAYAVVAALLIASIFAIPDLSFWLSTYMNKVLGPVLIAVGVVLLDVLPLRFATSCVTDQSGRRLGRSGPLEPAYWEYSSSFLFALFRRLSSSAACCHSRRRMDRAFWCPRPTGPERGCRCSPSQY
jgi:cytochrome c biogenesis protein CcdA